MHGSRKKGWKPPFLIILGQKASFWPKWPKRWKLSKKRCLEHFSRAYKPELTVKFQKKVMNRFREKALRMDISTYGQMLPLRSQRPVGRETKKSQKQIFTQKNFSKYENFSLVQRKFWALEKIRRLSNKIARNNRQNYKNNFWLQKFFSQCEK